MSLGFPAQYRVREGVDPAVVLPAVGVWGAVVWVPAVCPRVASLRVELARGVGLLEVVVLEVGLPEVAVPEVAVPEAAVPEAAVPVASISTSTSALGLVLESRCRSALPTVLLSCRLMSSPARSCSSTGAGIPDSSSAMATRMAWGSP